MSTTQDTHSDSDAIDRDVTHDQRVKQIEQLVETYSWSDEHVYGLDGVIEKIARGEWYSLIKKYIKCGNNKVFKNTWIWSICSATDCPNIGTERCQVPKEMCYAYNSEQRYGHTEDNPGGALHARRKRTLIWDCLDAQTFAETLIDIYHRKTSEVDVEFFRLNESGDFRSMHDVHKFNEIARILRENLGIVSYVYSASSHLEWANLDERHFTLNASNEYVALYADKRFTAFERGEFEENKNIVFCPYETTDGDIKCGECTRCINPKLGDTAIHIH